MVSTTTGSNTRDTAHTRRGSGSPITVVDTIVNEGEASMEKYLPLPDISASAAWELPVLDKEERSSHLMLSAVADLQDAHKEGNPSKIAEAWNSLGLIRLHTRKDPKRALECHQMSLVLSSKDPMKKAIVLNDIGLCYERTNQFEQAFQVYRQALDLLEDHVIESKHLQLCKQSLERTLARLHRQ
eukprot:scaffold22689_cov163-Cylindrotheca_fusiformis.AAC.4